jgi:hypothetical protein
LTAKALMATVLKEPQRVRAVVTKLHQWSRAAARLPPGAVAVVELLVAAEAVAVELPVVPAVVLCLTYSDLSSLAQ